MRRYRLLFPLLACPLALTAVVRPNNALAEYDFLQMLVEKPHLLPLSCSVVSPSNHRPRHCSYKFLARRLLSSQLHKLNLSKRDPQAPEEIFTMIGSFMNYATSLNAHAPLSKVADIQETESMSWPGARRKKIRYGPYRLPPTSEETFESSLLKVKGLTNTLKMSATKPCSGDCMIQSIGASVEYDDGRQADASTGVWLHHSILVNSGKQVEDPVCGGDVERVFESGNERTRLDFAVRNSTLKSSYRLHSTDSLLINNEFMNLDDKEKWVWLTLTYEYIDGFSPEYKESKVIWMSIGLPRCGGNETNPYGSPNVTVALHPLMNKFSEHSIPWTARRDGFLLGSNAHMHDGGLRMDVFKNNKWICTSTPHYNVSLGMSGMSGMQIDRYEGCEFDPPIPLKAGDRMHHRVDYDFTKHKGMLNSEGELDEVNGVTGSLLAFP